MSLEPGRMLVHYRLVEKIGEGGMGVVWKAVDANLDREVAIKILPELLARHPERLARFEREAKLLASLSHPGIAAVHGLHEHEGIRFIAMELVSGEDLAARLAFGPLPREEALAVALQVAEALEAAHGQGVIHRDLKPANVVLTPEGRAKILDFGLAKAFETDPGESGSGPSLSPTLTSAGTVAGVILGTAAYMSPEQAKGRPVDRRADIWALGVLLYEMLTGSRPFPGDSVSEALASVIKDAPEWTGLPPDTPRPVRRLLRRCLEKEPEKRLHDISDARLELVDAIGGTEEAAPSPPPPAAPAAPWKRALPWALVAALTLVSIVALWTAGRDRRTSPGPTHLSISLPPGAVLDAGPENRVLALSPDGRAVAYTALQDGVIRLHYRRLGAAEAAVLEDTDGAGNPFFSPDGQWIAFFAEGWLRKISVHGGVPIDLAEVSLNRGGAWPRDDLIVFAPTFNTPLMKLSASGEDLGPLTTLDVEADERSHRWPARLPGGEWVLFTVGSLENPSSYDDSPIDAVSLESGERRRIFEGASFARYAPSGHILLARGGSLLAAPFDASAPGRAGAAVPVLDGVATEPASGAAHFDVAPDGTLVFVPGSREGIVSELVWIGRDGRVEPIPAPPRPYLGPRLSPDGGRILVAVGHGAGDGDVWLYDLERGTLNRTTFDGRCGAPEWLSDGRRFLYRAAHARDRLLVTSLDGSVEARLVYELDRIIVPSSLTPDGEHVLFAEFAARGDISRVSLAGGAEPETVVHDESAKWGAVVSPDGRWMAYVSDESGRDEVYVQSFPRAGGKWQISSEGGAAPLWSGDGSELFYMRGRSLMSMPVDTTASTFSTGVARRLFELPLDRRILPFRPYDAAPDAQRFLVTRRRDAEVAMRRIDVVLGWSGSLAP